MYTSYDVYVSVQYVSLSLFFFLSLSPSFFLGSVSVGVWVLSSVQCAILSICLSVVFIALVNKY